MLADAPPRGLSFRLAPAQPQLDRIVDMAITLFGADAASLTLMHQGGVWRSRDPEDRLRGAGPLVKRVICSADALWIDDLANTGPISPPGNLDWRAYASVPIFGAAGAAIGALSIASLRPGAFDADRRPMLENLGGFAAAECARQQAALDLGQVQKALSAFVDSVPALVIVTDAQVRLLQASSSWFKNFRLDPETTLGKTLFEIMPEHFLPMRPAFERCLAGTPYRGDRRVPGPDGQSHYLRAEVSPWRNPDGQIGGLIGAALDITDMVEALDKSERTQQRLQLAMDIADLHVWETLYPAGASDQGLGAEAFFDASIDHAALLCDAAVTVNAEDRARVAGEWMQALHAGLPLQPEYRLRRPSGPEVWATCTAKLMRDEEQNPTHIIGVTQNITERKATEAAVLQAKEDAEAANRSKSAFLATMSHEIRTPLNGVLGMAQAMAADELSAAQRERLGVVRHSGEALLAILNDVLDLSKIESGKFELDLVEFDLSILAKGAHAAFTALADRKQLDFALTLEPGCEGRYRSDVMRIRQVLNNLISNALKFTEQGEVGVVVRRCGEALAFEVSDTGIGMQEAAIERLFAKFEQADASTTRRYGGTGLGLAICRELAEMLGGSVTATSVPGQGSTFRFQLPLERLGDEEDLRAAAPAEPSAEPEAELRILAAEDNAVNQLVLKTLLFQMGIEPTIVENGEAAVAAWREQIWDLVLMDIQMPVMDGPTATRLIREEEQRTGRPRTPILALTANAMAHQVTEYVKAGMDGVVPKPIEVTALFEAMSEAIGG